MFLTNNKLIKTKPERFKKVCPVNQFVWEANRYLFKVTVQAQALEQYSTSTRTVQVLEQYLSSINDACYKWSVFLTPPSLRSKTVQN